MTPEAVCLRRNSGTGSVEVYLTLRSPDNTAYPNQWNCPGAAMRPGEDVDTVFDRLAKNEMGLEIISKHFGFHFNNPTEARGHFFSLVYLCVLAEGEGRGKWFDVNQLPVNIIQHHKETVIPDMVKIFNLRGENSYAT